MKKLLYTTLLALVFTTGCVSQKVRDVASRNAARADQYVNLMESGETTPEQDRRYIHASRVAFWAFEWNVNGNEPPADVKLVLVELGLDPEGN